MKMTLLKNRLSVSMILFAVVTSVFLMPAMPVTAREIIYLETEATVRSANCIDLKWEKAKKATEYRIYRAKVVDYKIQKYKKIVTVKSGKTTYVDKNLKANTYYAYIVKAFKGKTKIAFGEAYYSYTGVPEASWYEYWYCDAPFSTDFVELCFSAENALKPDGLEVFRKTKNTSYKKIATIKAKNTSGQYFAYSYTDKKVKKNTKYYYKSRFYKTIGDKKVYGKFSEVGNRLTVNKSGTYTGKLESLTQEELIVSITADPDNGKTVINSGILSYHTAGYDVFDTEQGIRLISYSDNERNWTDFSPQKGVSVGPGQTVYLKLMPQEDQKISTEITDRACLSTDCDYNGFDCQFEFNLYNGYGSAWIDMERYH